MSQYSRKWCARKTTIGTVGGGADHRTATAWPERRQSARRSGGSGPSQTQTPESGVSPRSTSVRIARNTIGRDRAMTCNDDGQPGHSGRAAARSAIGAVNTGRAAWLVFSQGSGEGQSSEAWPPPDWQPPGAKPTSNQINHRRMAIPGFPRHGPSPARCTSADRIPAGIVQIRSPDQSNPRPAQTARRTGSPTTATQTRSTHRSRSCRSPHAARSADQPRRSSETGPTAGQSPTRPLPSISPKKSGR